MKAGLWIRGGDVNFNNTKILDNLAGRERDQGVGGAVAVLSSQADELKKSLDSARDASDQSGAVLKDLTQRAESVAQRIAEHRRIRRAADYQ